MSVTESDLTPGSLLVTDYAAKSASKRRKDHTLRVAVGVLDRKEAYRTTFVTYLIDYREYIRGYIVSPATHHTALQESSTSHLLDLIRPNIAYSGTLFLRTHISITSDQWTEIKRLSKHVSLDQVYALLRFISDEDPLKSALLNAP